MGKIISITNQKGGVGKTTTAINLASGLARNGKKILLIDIDPQGNATSGLGIDVTNETAGSYGIFTKNTSISDMLIETEFDGLKIVPSTTALIGAEIELIEIENRNMILKKALLGIRDDFDCIFIDCPPSLSVLTINALCASDSVIMPIQCEYFALEGLSQLLKTVNLVKESLNESLEIEGIVLTMSDARTNLTKQVIEEVKKYFPNNVYETVIPRSIKLSEAPSFGKPIYYYDEKSAGAQSYKSLAEEVDKRNFKNETINHENKGGILNEASIGPGLGSVDS